jgi:hypothetical protein
MTMPVDQGLGHSKCKEGADDDEALPRPMRFDWLPLWRHVVT